jgi:hypothetical protein
MDSIVGLFVQIVIALLVFSLLYWMFNLAAGLAPAPLQPKVRIVLLILLGLIVLMFLLGIGGIWGEWGYGYHHHWMGGDGHR